MEEKYLGFDRHPKALDVDPRYRGLRLLPKWIYSMLLSRSRLSEQQGDKYRDDQGVYVYYGIRELCDTLGYGKDAVGKALRSLEEVGLIRRRRVGYSTPYRIYVNDILGEPDNPPNNPPNMPPSTGRDTRHVLTDNPAPIYIDNIHNNDIYYTNADERAQIEDLIRQLHNAYPAHRRQAIADIDRAVRVSCLGSEDLRIALQNLDQYKRSKNWANDGGRYVPNVSKWLRNGQWRCAPDGGAPQWRRELDEDELDAIRQLMAEED